jgi:hypothetical protein
MRSKFLALPFVLLALLLAGQARAQQAFELPAAPKATPASTPTPVVTTPQVTTPEASAPVSIPTAPATPAPAKVTANATPKPKKTVKTSTKPAAKSYSGRVKITICNDQMAIGVDQSNGVNIACIPRFKGAFVGALVEYKGNRIIGVNANATTIAIAPMPGMADPSPYVPPPNAGQVVGGVISTAGSVLGILGSLHR